MSKEQRHSTGRSAKLDRRVLVIGATSDYIDLILRRHPGRVLFLTDARERATAAEPPPDDASEALCDLTGYDDALERLRAHMAKFNIKPGGIACYDCESMSLASHIARALGLRYVSSEAVDASRSKLVSKQLWRKAGLPCPQVELVRTADEAAAFLQRAGAPAVLKPLTGSGSELVFVCSSRDDCAHALRIMTSRLAEHSNVRMYSPSAHHKDARRTFAIEEFVAGDEYSCDFLLEGGRADIIRLAKKVHAPGHAPGTIMAYVVPADLPPDIQPDAFRRQLAGGATALGIDAAICMLDFIVRRGEAVMLEMTPRPGGDCLPPLLLKCSGLDILGLALDFAEGRPLKIPPPREWRRLVGLRLLAPRPGVVQVIDDTPLRQDRRVLESSLTRGPGHKVIFPPEDYDSRILGHAVFEPSRPDDIEGECLEIAAKLKLELGPP